MSGATMTDAGPVRAHLDRLYAAGMSYRAIAETIGMPESTFRHHLLRREPPTHVDAYVARRILAVRPNPGAGLISPIGTRRRLQALIAIGWSVYDIAAVADCNPDNLFRIAKETTDAVRGDAATRIRYAYDRMKDRHPAKSYPAGRCRQMAIRRGWRTPFAWDGNIDDPYAEPDGGIPTASLYPERRKRERQKRTGRVDWSEALRLVEHGESVQIVAAQFGVQAETVAARVAEHLSDAA